MANRKTFTTVVRMGAAGFSLKLLKPTGTETLDLTGAGRRAGVERVRSGALAQDLSELAGFVCAKHGIKDKTLRGAKGKFLKRGKPQFRKERREAARHGARA